MDVILSNLALGFQTAFSFQNLYLCVIGCLFGTIVGVLPGMGPLAGISLLIPITYGIDVMGSFIMLAGIYYGAMYGGSTTSILMNIPGETASVITCLDGYQMAQKGRAGAALFVSAWGSLIGGGLSIIGLMLVAPMLANIAVKFGPPEIFALLLVAFMLLGSLGSGSFVKSISMVILGMFVGTIGMDELTGAMRYTHGVKRLFDGLGFIPVMMGFFGVGEIFASTEESLVRVVQKVRLRDLLPSKKEILASSAPMLRGSLVGFGVGVLPGPAPTLSTFLSYMTEKKLGKNPEEFGTGRIEGVAGPETANNAATGGQMVPFLALGIPPGPATAAMMVALMIHGVQPGPLFISQQPQLFWGLIVSMLLGNLILVILNLPLVGVFVNLLRVPFRTLFPVVLLICLVGSYSVNMSTFDLAVLLGAGLLGYFFRKLKYDLAPFAIAMIIGPTMEYSFRQALVRSAGNFSIFTDSPIAMTFIGIACLLLLWNISKTFRQKKPAAVKTSNA